MKILKEFISKYPAFFLVALIEGGMVMLVEMASGHLFAAQFGNSVYLWAGILGNSLAGLGAGYYFGSLLSKKNNPRVFFIVLTGIAILSSLLPIFSGIFSDLLQDLDPGLVIFIACFLSIFPVLSLCGIVSPMLVQSITTEGKYSGRSAGIIFSVSTFGGILLTFFSAFYFFPGLGIKKTLLLFSGFILIAGTWNYLQSKRKPGRTS